MNSPFYVYLLHFKKKYPRGGKPQHYVGVTKNLPRRLREHENGTPKSKLMQALKQEGITFALVTLWLLPTRQEAYDWERLLKRSKHHHRHCPVCRRK